MTKEGAVDKKKYIFLATPVSQRGYLIVPFEQLKQAISYGATISEYSFIVGKEVYLEEDSDAGEFITAMGISDDDIIKRHGDFTRMMFPAFKQEQFMQKYC